MHQTAARVPLQQGSGNNIYLHLSVQTPQGISPSLHRMSSPHRLPKRTHRARSQLRHDVQLAMCNTT